MTWNFLACATACFFIQPVLAKDVMIRSQGASNHQHMPYTSAKSHRQGHSIVHQAKRRAAGTAALQAATAKEVKPESYEQIHDEEIMKVRLAAGEVAEAVVGDKADVATTLKTKEEVVGAGIPAEGKPSTDMTQQIVAKHATASKDSLHDEVATDVDADPKLMNVLTNSTLKTSNGSEEEHDHVNALAEDSGGRDWHRANTSDLQLEKSQQQANANMKKQVSIERIQQSANTSAAVVSDAAGASNTKRSTTQCKIFNGEQGCGEMKLQTESECEDFFVRAGDANLENYHCSWNGTACILGPKCIAYFAKQG